MKNFDFELLKKAFLSFKESLPYSHIEATTGHCDSFAVAAINVLESYGVEAKLYRIQRESTFNDGSTEENLLSHVFVCIPENNLCFDANGVDPIEDWANTYLDGTQDEDDEEHQFNEFETSVEEIISIRKIQDSNYQDFLKEEKIGEFNKIIRAHLFNTELTQSIKEDEEIYYIIYSVRELDWEPTCLTQDCFHKPKSSFFSSFENLGFNKIGLVPIDEIYQKTSLGYLKCFEEKLSEEEFISSWELFTGFVFNEETYNSLKDEIKSSFRHSEHPLLFTQKIIKPQPSKPITF